MHLSAGREGGEAPPRSERAQQRGKKPHALALPLPAERRCPAPSPEHGKRPKNQEISAAPTPRASSAPGMGGIRMVRGIPAPCSRSGTCCLQGSASEKSLRALNKEWAHLWTDFRNSSYSFSPEKCSGYQQEEQQRKKGEGIGLRQESLTVLSTLLFNLVGPAGLRAVETAEP